MLSDFVKILLLKSFKCLFLCKINEFQEMPKTKVKGQVTDWEKELLQGNRI